MKLFDIILDMNDSWARHVIKWMIFACFIPIYLPVFALLSIAIKLSTLQLMLKTWIARWHSRDQDSSTIAPIFRSCKAEGVNSLSLEEQLDFTRHRKSCYLARLAFWTPYEISVMFAGLQSTPLVSDGQLAYVVLNTVFAHSVKWNSRRRMYHLKMDGIADLTLFDGFFYDAREILVSRDGRRIAIVMFNGTDTEEFRSDDPDPRHSDLYRLAKLHAQICLTYYAPGLAHNHVHFVLPGALSLASRKLLDRRSVLYKLLAPHFRFTEAINQQALRVGKATDNKRSVINRLFYAWQCFPVTKEQFLQGVAEKCTDYYHEQGGCDPSATYQQQQQPLEESSVDSGSEKEDEQDNLLSSSDEEKEDLEKRDRMHMIFPPRYITDPTLAQIPYLKFLRRYYYAVRKFVKTLEPMIDCHEWHKLAEEVQKHVPRFTQVDMVEAITTFIHQAAVVHFSDHSSYLNYFAWQHGCTSLRFPFAPYADERVWKPMLRMRRRKITIEQAKANPELLVRKRDIMRTRCFLNMFVDFIPSSTVDMRLVKTRYKFGKDQVTANRAANQFITDLRRVDGRLKNMEPSMQIERLPGENRAIGMQIIKLDDMIRSVCY